MLTSKVFKREQKIGATPLKGFNEQYNSMSLRQSPQVPSAFEIRFSATDSVSIYI